MKIEKEIRLKELNNIEKIKYWVMWFTLSLPFWILINYLSSNLFTNFYQTLFCGGMLLMGYFMGGFGGRIIDKYILRSVHTIETTNKEKKRWIL